MPPTDQRATARRNRPGSALVVVVAAVVGLAIGLGMVVVRFGGPAGAQTPSSATTPSTTTPASTTPPSTPSSTATSTSTPTSGPEPVPCQVALVVGCVTTVDGEDGPVPLTLRVAAADGEGSDSDTPAFDSAATTGTLGSAAVGAAQLVPADEEEPARSGVDPWERGGLRSNFGTASIPISHYQVGADTTGFMGVPDPLDSFVASQTNWAFTTSAFLVLLSTNTLDWAFEFPLANDLVGRAGLLAQDYTIDFFGFGLDTSIYALALSVTMVVAGFKAVTKGLIAAGSDVLLAFMAYVVLVVLTMTSGFGDAGLHVARLSSDLSGSIASFASGQQRQEECAAALTADREASSVAGATASTDGTAGAADSPACSFGFALQRSLVELPYQNLQWGQVLDGVAGKERCAQVNRELLTEGAWGNLDEPRERMGAIEECQENAEFNSQATYIRLGIASANALAAAIATLLVLVVAAMLLWQQLKLLFLTAVLPHTLVFAILPGRSRALAWRWLEQLVGVVIRTVILALGLVVWLSLFSLIVYEQLTFRGIFLSLFASTAMSVAGFYGLYKLSGLTARARPLAAATGLGQSDDDPRTGGRRTDDGDRGSRRQTATRAGASVATARRTVRTRPAEPEKVGAAAVGAGGDAS